MIQKLKSPKEREVEYKKWLESLPEDERKKIEERDKQKIAYEQGFSKIIIEDAVKQKICSECDSSFELPEEAQILLPYSFYECKNIQAAYIHDNIRVCTKETFLETDEILLTNPVYKKENGLMINTFLGIILYADNDLDDIIVPEGVIEIAPYAFSGCDMKSIHLPESLEKIGEHCFVGCSNLETIAIPSKIKEIKQHCFHHCSKLKEIKLSEGLEIIGPYSMRINHELEICILPNSLKKIGKEAFSLCSKLKEVAYKESIELEDGVFLYCDLLKGKVPSMCGLFPVKAK